MRPCAVADGAAGRSDDGSAEPVRDGPLSEKGDLAVGYAGGWLTVAVKWGTIAGGAGGSAGTGPHSINLLLERGRAVRGWSCVLRPLFPLTRFGPWLQATLDQP